MSTFQKTYKIRFQHCDPAGIVFYPRYYELINALVEDYFEEVLGLSHSAICASDLGIPMRHMEVSFDKPSYLGEEITLFLTPLRIGTSSLKFGIDILSDTNERRVVGQFVIVFIDNTLKKPVGVPEEIAQIIHQAINARSMARDYQMSDEEC